MSKTEEGLGGHKNRGLFKSTVREVILINSLNFNLRRVVRVLLEILLVLHSVDGPGPCCSHGVSVQTEAVAV
jgi:hypothetical protein